MNPTNVTTIALLTVKLFALVGIALYAVFAGIMVRQEQLMADVLEEAFEPILRLATIAHFVAAVGVLLLAVILL